MPLLIEARDLTKKYGNHIALDHAAFTVETGRIVGLIGPNGCRQKPARCAPSSVLHPTKDICGSWTGSRSQGRAALMNDACFIADVAILPSWLRVDQAIDFVAAVHPRFRRDRALALLAKTQIAGTRRMRELSKGMKTQVHLALTMAIDAKLFVLDEPTLGLDILARGAPSTMRWSTTTWTRRAPSSSPRTRWKEVENLLTDVLFIDTGPDRAGLVARGYRQALRRRRRDGRSARRRGARSSRSTNAAPWARPSCISKNRTSRRFRSSAKC